jgi:acetyl-CoA carboxylase carboxyltransferase component
MATLSRRNEIKDIDCQVERLGPRARLERLCDAGTLELLRGLIQSRHVGTRLSPGDGVVAGIGRVAGRPVACYAQDGRHMAGSLGEAHAETIARVMDIAARGRFPVVSFVESAGARVQEGATALEGYAAIFRRNVDLAGKVPQISVVSGTSAGGGCYSPALTDFVVMTKDASMFLTGPGVLKEVAGEEVSPGELGGHRIHERNGVCHLVADGDHSSVRAAQELLGYLPREVGGELPSAVSIPPLTGDPGVAVPDRSRAVYDVRDVLAGIVDAGSVLEIAPRWARSIFTGLARLGGSPVGIVANQPRYRGGVLDSESSQKGARFVETCDRFGLPLIVLVDTPGFMPGSKQERAGVIRLGATLVRAFAGASVPRITVILRKAFGGAYITMNAKGLGADVVFAWPRAEVGVMGAEAAVGVTHRRELSGQARSEARRRALAKAYAEEHLNVSSAARRGFVDEVIEPVETRQRLTGVLGAMANHD